MTFRKAGLTILWSALLLLPTVVRAQTDSSYVPSDSTVVAAIDSTVFSAEARTGMILCDWTQARVIQIETGSLSKIPSILGAADPLKMVRWLPGVQTGSEIDAGLHIQGCEHGHNIISMDGVPIYGATHILGIFSAFNPDHFRNMTYATSATSWNRLGGQIDLVPKSSVPKHVEGNILVSPVYAMGTLRFATGKKSALGVSARQSFLNLLYKPFLKIEGQPFRYSFGDYNLSWAWNPSSSDKVRIDAYGGMDNVFYWAANNALNIDMGWWNLAGAVHWTHTCDAFTLRQSVYGSSFNLGLELTHEGVSGSIPSYLRTFGSRTVFNSDVGFTAQADVAWHEALPQQLNVMSGYLKDIEPEKEQTALESSLMAGYSYQVSDWLTLDASLKGIFYLSPERKPFWGLSPYAGARFNFYRGGVIDLRAGLQHQYLFQTGLTSLGFPIEFWLLAGKYSAPQRSAYATVSYGVSLPDNTWSFSGELYFRRLYNQLDYDGNIMDFLTSSYSLDKVLLSGDGWNYGLSLMVQKQTGRLTGWAGYTIGRSLRSYGDGVFPSNHERIHEFNLVGVYDGRGWSAGATFVAASGTPFTAPETFYLYGGQLIAKYGPHNGARVRPYIRMDVCFNVALPSRGRFKHGLEASVYNVLGRRNDVIYLLMVGDDIPQEYNPYPYPVFAYRPQSYALRFMPSLAWKCSF